MTENHISGEKRYWQYESARTLFEQLKATGRYRIVFAGELTEKLAEFVPESRKNIRAKGANS